MIGPLISLSAQDSRSSTFDALKLQSESDELLVALRPKTDAAALARQHTVTLLRTLLSDPDMHVFKAASVKKARKAKRTLAADAAVRSVAYNLPALETTQPDKR